MIYFTKYAEEKFELLNAHKVYIRKEEVKTAVNDPDAVGRIGKLQTAQRKNVKVIYEKSAGVKKIITFYPI